MEVIVHVRMYVLLKCIEILGKDHIHSIIADSEFIGTEWIKFLVMDIKPIVFLEMDSISSEKHSKIIQKLTMMRF